MAILIPIGIGIAKIKPTEDVKQKIFVKNS
jgi:hypothetical protein